MLIRKSCGQILSKFTCDIFTLDPHRSLPFFFSHPFPSFLNAVAQSTTIYAPPTMTFTAGRRLGTSLTGYLTCRTGEWGLGPWGKDPRFRREKSAVAIGIGGSGKRSTYSAEIQVGLRGINCYLINGNAILNFQPAHIFISITFYALHRPVSPPRTFPSSITIGSSTQRGYASPAAFQLRADCH